MLAADLIGVLILGVEWQHKIMLDTPSFLQFANACRVPNQIIFLVKDIVESKTPAEVPLKTIEC